MLGQARTPGGGGELRGARALVTGAAGGLGRYITRALAGQGVNLAVSDLPGSEIEAAPRSCRGLGVEAQAVPADLTDSGERERLVAGRRGGRGPARRARQQRRARVRRRVHEDHARGARGDRGRQPDRGHGPDVAGAARDAGAPPRPCRQPRLAGGEAPRRSSSRPYAATKHGVVGFTHALRAEYADEPVSFSAICPVFVGRRGHVRARRGPAGQGAPTGTAAGPIRSGSRTRCSRRVREDRAEVIVNRGPIRPLAALYWLAPKTAGRLLGSRRDPRVRGGLRPRPRTAVATGDPPSRPPPKLLQWEHQRKEVVLA